MKRLIFRAARTDPSRGLVFDLHFEAVLRKPKFVKKLGGAEEIPQFVVVEPDSVTEKARVDLQFGEVVGVFAELFFADGAQDRHRDKFAGASQRPWGG